MNTDSIKTNTYLHSYQILILLAIRIYVNTLKMAKLILYQNIKNKTLKNDLMSLTLVNRDKKKQILTAKQHVINLANIPLNDDQYILLAKGLKFITKPSNYNIHRELLQSFDEFARKKKDVDSNLIRMMTLYIH